MSVPTGCCVGERLKACDFEEIKPHVLEEKSKAEDLQTQTSEGVQEILSAEEKAVMYVMSKTLKGRFETIEDIKLFFDDLNRTTYLDKHRFFEKEDTVTMAYVVQRINECKQKIPHFEEDWLCSKAA